MKARIIAGSKGVFLCALFFVLLGLVKQWRHIADAVDMYYIAVLDVLIAFCMFAIAGGLKKVK